MQNPSINRVNSVNNRNSSVRGANLQITIKSRLITLIIIPKHLHAHFRKTIIRASQITIIIIIIIIIIIKVLLNRKSVIIRRMWYLRTLLNQKKSP